jgi:hypothetical protein
MRVFVYDLEPGGRLWHELLSPHEPVAWDPRADESKRGDLIVCHDTTATRGVVAAKKAAARRVAVLFVSAGPLSGALDSGIYYRGAPVEKPTDAAFNAAFRRFASHLQQTGEARWDLIEPLKVPEHLLAYYLFDLADMRSARPRVKNTASS